MTQNSAELKTAQQQIAHYNELAAASEEEVHALHAAASLQQQQVHMPTRASAVTCP